MKKENPMSETAIRLHVEEFDDSVFVATSPDVPGLVAEGRTLTEAAEIAQGLVRKFAESCIAHGDPLPPALADTPNRTIELLVPVGVY
jgi:predicted RNase H-like HicB family nuclease